MKVLDPGIESLLATKQLCYYFNYAENLKDFFFAFSKLFLLYAKVRDLLAIFHCVNVGFWVRKARTHKVFTLQKGRFKIVSKC